MTPKKALETIAFTMSLLPGCYPSRGASYYIERGKPIPGFLLPGRAIMMLKGAEREALGRLTSDDARDVPDWAIRQFICDENGRKLVSSH
jgi:hypothetical protein